MRRSVMAILFILVLVGCGDSTPAALDTTDSTSPTTTTTVPTTIVEAPTAPTTTTATTTTTTVPTTTTTIPEPTTTLAAIGSLGSGLFCRDVAALGYGYADAVAYWTREGRPDRMDADRNGIPCETVYDRAAVVAFWGEPLPTSTSTTTDVWYWVATPEYQVASLPGAGGNYGSGCSPGSNTLPDGIWFGSIATADNSKIEFDLMCFGPGPEGPGDVTNSNPKLRTVPVDPAAIVYMVVDGGTGWQAIPYAPWLAIPPSPFCSDGCLYWLYVNDGVVTEAVELWFA